MATAKKTAAQSAPKTAAAPKPKAPGKPGSNPAKDAAADASAKSAAYNAKAEAVKAAKDAKSGNDPEKRYVVAQGKTVRSKGVRFFAGEAIDLPQSDGERLKAEGVLIDDDNGKTAKESPAPSSDEGTGGEAPLAAGDAAPAGTEAGNTDGTASGDGAGAAE